MRTFVSLRWENYTRVIPIRQVNLLPQARFERETQKVMADLRYL